MLQPIMEDNKKFKMYTEPRDARVEPASLRFSDILLALAGRQARQIFAPSPI